MNYRKIFQNNSKKIIIVLGLLVLIAWLCLYLNKETSLPTGVLPLEERKNISNAIYGDGEIDETTGVSKQWIESFGVEGEK